MPSLVVRFFRQLCRPHSATSVNLSVFVSLLAFVCFVAHASVVLLLGLAMCLLNTYAVSHNLQKKKIGFLP